MSAVFEAADPYLFEIGALVVTTDPRWFQSLPPDGEGAPLMEIRRWPGDTVVAFYDLAGGLSSAEGRRPPLEQARLELDPAGNEWGESWSGVLETDAGPRPVVWIERRVAAGGPRLAALLIPGDAGGGAGWIADLTREARAVVDRAGVREAAWLNREGIPVGTSLVVPRTSDVPGDLNEEEDPWQIAGGRDFTVGMPPGFRARRTDAGLESPFPVPGGRLWFRGRVVDTAGTRVAVGDARRAGYVAEVIPADDDWVTGKKPPLGVPGGKRLASENFGLVAERAGAERCRAERWSEPGFDGQWLVFRILFAERGIELAMPVVAGRRSPSLFWIAATFRGPGKAPAPPPVDPAERFGIKWERFTPTERKRQPWYEGYLTVPGLRVALPTGWMPAASLRSRDGFPIRFIDADGGWVGFVTRLEVDDLADFDAAGGGWTAADKIESGERHTDAVWLRDDATRMFVSKEGHGFLFQPRTTDDETMSWWARLLESVLLTRSESPRTASDGDR